MNAKWIFFLLVCLPLVFPATSWSETLPEDCRIAGLQPVEIQAKENQTGYWYRKSFISQKEGTLQDSIQVFDETLSFRNWTCDWWISESETFTGRHLVPEDELYEGDVYYLHAWMKYAGSLTVSDDQLEGIRPAVLLLPVSGIETDDKKPSPSWWSYLWGSRAGTRTVATKAGPPNNLIIFMIDTLRSDHTPPYNHPFVIAPHLDMLANLGTVFTQSYGASSSTRPSVGTMFTGIQPYAHGAVRHALTHANLYSSVPILPEIMRNNGYETVGISSNAQVTSAFGFARGFDRYECPVGEHQVTPKALQYLQTLSEPFFLYLHYMAPHQPYEPPAILHGLYEGKTEYEEQDKYCAEITLEDRRIGLVLNELVQQGLLDRSMIWLVSDHGEEFWEHGWNGHGAKLYEESVRTVSILSAPQWLPTGKRVDEPVMHTDMLPTINGVFGFDPPEIQQGINLIPLTQGESNDSPRPVFLHHGGGLEPEAHPSDKNAVVLGDYKLIWWNQKDEWELYNLKTDPLERKNLVDRNPATTTTLKALLMSHWDSTQAIGDMYRSKSGADTYDRLRESDLENLRANGYID